MRSGPSPKQPQCERLKDWYPYYAGFPSDFVRAALSQHFAIAQSLVDPWNGSGTTTAVAAGRGLRSVGVDINPAVTVIARARLTPVGVLESLEPVAHEIVIASERYSVPHRSTEPLNAWLHQSATSRLRHLQRAINDVVVGEDALEAELAESPEVRTSTLPVLAAFYYTALFAAVRDLLAPFRSSNPTWLRQPRRECERIDPSEDLITAAFRRRVRYLAARIHLPSEAGERAVVSTGSALTLGGSNLYDACLSSPPYATRVDYVRNTLAELAVLGLSNQQLAALRRITTGTPVVRGVHSQRRALMSETANQVIARVETHPSHGSYNYYGPWIRNYLSDLEASFQRICRAVKDTGTIGLVVQDSYYKSLHIDLQQIITENLLALGYTVKHREDHESLHSRARMNPRARKHLETRTNHESLIVFVSNRVPSTA